MSNIRVFIKVLGLSLFTGALVNCKLNEKSLPWVVELAATTELSSNQFVNSNFGGISGLDYQADSNEFFAVSDDRSEHSKARYYRFSLDLNYQLKDLTSTVLLDEAGNTFNRGKVDAESIRFHPEGWFVWSSELGVEGPAVYVTELSENRTQKYDLPNYIMNESDDSVGARENKFIEGISFSPDYKNVFFGLEAPLRQDGDVASVDRTGLSRILVYDVMSRKQIAEYLYEIDAVPKAAEAMPFLQDNGVSEILAVNSNTLLILERSGRHVGGNNFSYDNRIYMVRLNEATNIRGVRSVSKDTLSLIKTVKKQRLITISEFVDGEQGNFEGMTFGPRIDGWQSLYLVSDNNFKKKKETKLLVFKLKLE